MSKHVIYHHNVLPIHSFGTDPRIAVYNSVNCADPNLLVLEQCTYSTSVQSGCTDDEDISVICC